MKKFLALFLACLFIVTAFAGCSSGDKKDNIKGAVVQTYFGNVPTSIDPASVYTTTDVTKIMGLIFEGLTTIDENGKLQKALAKDWECEVDERDGLLKLEITLEDSRWSDGIILDADDFVYAWQRILSPSSDNANAALLYPVLNAKAVKEGLASINDLGVRAVSDKVIEITFESEFTDYEYFLTRLASPALVPLREDIVARGEEWCLPTGSTWVSNGPFKVKLWKDSEFIIERNTYYRCVSDYESNKVDKVVKPHQFVNLYSEGKNADAQYLRFIDNKNASEEFTPDNKSFYINLNGASQETIQSVGKKAKTDVVPATYVMFFNPENELFSDARVRKALSLAIDRQALVNAAPVELESATGFIPFGVSDKKEKDSFRKNGGDIISASANLDEAKSLLKQAGVSGGTIVIECSNYRGFEKDMLELIASSWKNLGFKVDFSALRANYIYNKANGTVDFNQNDADIICYDITSMSADAYSILTGFSGKFGGGFIDVTTGPDQSDVVYNANYTGFIDSEYDALCEEFILENDSKNRSEKMHKAEEYLAEFMPVIPLFFENDVYVSAKLSNVNKDKFGRFDFTELKQSGFKKYLTPEEEE